MLRQALIEDALRRLYPQPVLKDYESDEPCADGSDSEGPDTDDVSSERSDDPLGDWDADFDELLRRHNARPPTPRYDRNDDGSSDVEDSFSQGSI